MKKNFKLVLALVLSLMMVLGSMSALATSVDPEHTTADNYTLTINNLVKDHEYSIYQIFDGSKANNNTQVQYVEATVYAENTVYYEKKGADFYPKTVADATAFGTITATTTLYTRTGDSALGDVVWGSSITDAGKKALYTAYNMSVADDKINDIANIKALLEKIADKDNTSASESDKAVKFSNVFFTTTDAGEVTKKDGLLGNAVATTGKLSADGNHTFNNLASGYYIVNDEWKGSDTAVNGVDYSIARIAVQVVGNTIINNKADKIVADKKIKTSAELINEKANEVGIGRTVEYVVTETVPNYDGYNYYYFVMCDTLSNGLTFDPDSVVVKVDGTEITKKTSVAADSDGKGYFVYYDKASNSSGITTASTGAAVDGVTFVIAFEDIMKFEVGKPIEVTYNANVNSEAITGVDPNTNKIFVNYSNHPEKSDKHDTDGHPGIPANREDTPVGKTPDRWTDTYTTKLTINKVDENGNALKDVEFTLTGKSKDVVVNTEEVFELDDSSDATYYMLKDGTYTETAPTSQATLEETKDNSGWVEIGASDTYDEPDVRIVNGKRYRPFVIATDQDKTRYVIVEGNAATYASTTLRYKKVTITTTSPATTKTDEYEVARVGKTDATGVLEFSQLGAGTYTLSETKVRPGYNDIQDITFTITCELPAQATVVAGTEKAKWTTTVTSTTGVITEVTTGEGENKKGTGNFTMSIVNNKGVELPSTGGIGTTIFYVAGSLMVLAAAILLITKRRMGAND